MDETKSFCDPYVFNTAITRAKSLVIAVGNPFLLLNMEKSFVRIYGSEHNAHCWSTYLNCTFEKQSFEFDNRLQLTEDQKIQLEKKIKAEIHEIQKFKRLEEENAALVQQVKEHEALIHDKDKEIEDLKRQLKEERQVKALPSSPEETSRPVPENSSIATGWLTISYIIMHIV